ALLLACVALTPPPIRGDEPPPAADAKARTDANGDLLPSGAVMRLGTVRFRHPLLTSAVCFSPDGKVLATACWDRPLCIWDDADGRLRRKIRLPEDCPFLSSLVFSPDSKTVASAGAWDEVVYLWEVATGKRVHRLSHPKGRVAAVAVSPDGKWIATGGSE